MSQTWDGVLRATDLHPTVLERRVAVADAADNADWAALFAALGPEGPEAASPNVWRPDGRTWSTPLHQVAWHDAPIEVADALIHRGAWRTLRDADGRTPHDVAVAKGHTALAARLAPVVTKVIDSDVIARLDGHFAGLVDAVIRGKIAIPLRYPSVEVLTEIAPAVLWFPIPGMYGGFRVELLRSYLFVESWSRVAGGSGRAHVVTTEGVTLVEKGFV